MMTEQELSQVPESSLSGIAKVIAAKPRLKRAEAEAIFGKDAIVDDPADPSGKKWIGQLDKRKDKHALAKYRELSQPWRREAVRHGFESNEALERVPMKTQAGDQREIRAELEDHMAETHGMRRPGKILPANFDAQEQRRKRQLLASLIVKPPGLYISSDDCRSWRWASCDTIQQALAMEA